MAEEPQSGTVGAKAKTLTQNLWFPALFFFGFLLCYMLPFHAPEPHDVKVAVSGPVAAAELEAGLEEKAPGAYDIISVSGPEQARAHVLDREAEAAYATDGDKATLYVAEANGMMLEQTVSSTFGSVAEEQNVQLETDEVAPTADGDGTGTSLFYLAMAWNIAPYVSVMMLMRATDLSRRNKLCTLAVVGAAMSAIGYAAARALNIVPAEPLTMLYGFLLSQAIAWTVYGLAPIVKQYIIGVAITLFVLFSIPSSGGAVPYQLVPAFFRWLHPVMPLGNFIEAMQGLYYFDGKVMLQPTVVLLAWMALGAALIGVDALRQRKKQRQTEGEPEEEGAPPTEPVEPAEAAEDRVEDPSLETPVPHAVRPPDAAEHRPPMLRGRVTDADGAPVTDAVITVTDHRGHELLRARTDSDGWYAATDLPENFVNVLLTAPGRLPSVVRVLPSSGRPQRQDFTVDGRSRRHAAVPST